MTSEQAKFNKIPVEFPRGFLITTASNAVETGRLRNSLMNENTRSWSWTGVGRIFISNMALKAQHFQLVHSSDANTPQKWKQNHRGKKKRWFLSKVSEVRMFPHQWTSERTDAFMPTCFICLQHYVLQRKIKPGKKKLREMNSLLLIIFFYVE